MRNVLAIAFGIVSVAVAFADRPDSTGFALVELYTSEGCSSCPPADVVAAQLAEDAASSGKPVHVLAFHVDYWDDLGWPDRFATSGHTLRQRRYASALSGGRMYTPQIVVNGRTELVGSREVQVKRAVRGALEQKPVVVVELTTIEVIKDELRVKGRLAGEHERLIVIAALVEDDLVTRVERGENKGRTLHHDRVVRSFTTTEAAADIELTLPLRDDVVRENATVVVFVQQPNTLEIVGAAEKALPASSRR